MISWFFFLFTFCLFRRVGVRHRDKHDLIMFRLDTRIKKNRVICFKYVLRISNLSKSLSPSGYLNIGEQKYVNENIFLCRLQVGHKTKTNINFVEIHIEKKTESIFQLCPQYISIYIYINFSSTGNIFLQNIDQKKESIQ